MLTLIPPSPSLSSALSTNSHSALSLALLLLPPSFTEDGLWEQIAGLSYSGDPRMSVPGAENPEKVRNIVRGEGAREGFREVYGGLLRGLGIRWKGEDKGDKEGWEWKGNGEEMMVVGIPNTLPQFEAKTDWTRRDLMDRSTYSPSLCPCHSPFANLLPFIILFSRPPPPQASIPVGYL